MPKAIVKDLEIEILSLPEKEKDKLLLRLIAKNKILIEQLHFKLLEDPVLDLKSRLIDTKEKIDSEAHTMNGNTFKQVIRSIRTGSACINHFKKITADKIGEVELNLHLLEVYFKIAPKFLQEGDYVYYYESLYIYVVKKTIALKKLIEKLHEDFYIEYAGRFNSILEKTHRGPLKSIAKELNLDKTFEI